MDKLVNIILYILAFILGGGAFYFMNKRSNGSIKLPIPPTTEELDKIRKEKEDELRKQDPHTFINTNLSNASTINDIESTSDAEFDNIYNKHRNE